MDIALLIAAWLLLGLVAFIYHHYDSGTTHLDALDLVACLVVMALGPFFAGVMLIRVLDESGFRVRFPFRKR